MSCMLYIKINNNFVSIDPHYDTTPSYLQVPKVKIFLSLLVAVLTISYLISLLITLTDSSISCTTIQPELSISNILKAQPTSSVNLKCIPIIPAMAWLPQHSLLCPHQVQGQHQLHESYSAPTVTVQYPADNGLLHPHYRIVALGNSHPHLVSYVGQMRDQGTIILMYLLWLCPNHNIFAPFILFT